MPTNPRDINWMANTLIERVMKAQRIYRQGEVPSEALGTEIAERAMVLVGQIAADQERAKAVPGELPPEAYAEMVTE